VHVTTQVLLARIDCLRRAGREGYAATKAAFEAASSLLTAYFPDFVDRQLRLTAYAAQCALRIGGGADEARGLWNNALKSPAGRWRSLSIVHVLLLYSMRASCRWIAHVALLRCQLSANSAGLCCASCSCQAAACLGGDASACVRDEKN
jgi:hypothetical protein